MADSTSDSSDNALAHGTRLGEFEIRRVLGVGGFGIVYLALDHALEREVAIKEYLPVSLAGRGASHHVSLLSAQHEETFALGLRSFVNEARLLARFDHPSLLKVHRFWEQNGTAYMVMPYYRGQTFKAMRKTMSGTPGEAWLRGVLEPVLGALDVLHREGVYHRDIAPDNIMMVDGKPVLLDFGAARRVIGDGKQALTAILKPSYAPIEQYAESATVRQGAFTDLYALGATMHFLIKGQPPMPSTMRSIQDDQLPLATQAIAGCSPAFLQVIDWMLAPRPNDRPQTVGAVLEVLRGRAEAPARPVPTPAPAPVPRPAAAAAPDDDAERTRLQPRTVDPEATVVAPAALTRPAPLPAPPAARGATVAPSPAWAAPPVPVAMAAAAPATPGPAHRLLWPLVGLGVVVAGAAATVLLLDASMQRAPPAEPPPMVAPAALPATEPAAEPAGAAPVSAASEPPAAVAEPPALAAPDPSTAAPPVRSAVRPAPTPRAAPAPLPPLALPYPPSASENPAIAPPPAVPAGRSSPPPAPAPAPAAAVADSRAARPQCGGRVLIALTACMARECARPDTRQHAECVAWERSERERKNKIEQGF